MHRIYPLFLCVFSLIHPVGLSAQWEATGTPGTAGVNVIQKIGTRLEAATSGGDYFSEDDGLTWTKRLNSPGAGLRAYKGVYYVYSSANVAFYKSYDRGETWNFIVDNTGFLSQGITDFAVVGDTVFATNSYKVWRNLPNSSNWSIVYETSIFGDMRLIPADKYLWLIKKQILRSADGGSSWQNMTPPGATISNAVVHGDTIMASIQGGNGVYYSTDSGQNWEKRGNTPSGKISYSEGAYAVFNSSKVFVSWDKGLHWKEFPFGPNSVSFSNGLILIGLSNGLLRSIDQGDHWLYSHTNLNPNSSASDWEFQDLGSLVVTSPQIRFSYDRGSHWFSPLFAGGIEDFTHKSDSIFMVSFYYKSLYRSFGNLSVWDTVSLGFIPGTIEQLERGDAGLYLVELFQGVRNTYFSSDNGQNWVKQGQIPFLMIDFDAQADALFGLDVGGDVYVSLDRGMSWELRKNGLDYPINDMFISGNYAYAYRYNSIQGVFYVSTDFGENWVRIPATIDRSVSYTAKDNKVFIGDVFGEVYWIDGPNGEWKNISDNLPDHIGANGIGIQGNTLFFINKNNLSLYRRELSSFGVNTAAGIVFKDNDNNGRKEPGEPGLANIPVISQLAGSLSFTDINGGYHITVGQLPDELAAVPPGPYSVITPGLQLVPTVADTLYSFAVTVQPGTRDVQTDLTLNGVLLSGKASEYVLTVQNVGSDTVFTAPKLWFPPVLDLLSVSPSSWVQNADTIVWTAAAIAPQALKRFRARVHTPVNTPAGVLVPAGAEAFLSMDLSPANNSVNRIDTVYNAFDPNYKESVPKRLTPGDVSAHRPIEYTIHFQNTGNYPASIVRLEDTISSRLLLSSFELVAGSHPVRMEMRDGRVLEFIFDNINLPDSSRDEAGSHGFVKYRLQPSPNLSIGDEIHNQAFIYFDYNKAVATNLHVLPVIHPTINAVDAVLKAVTLRVFPNPVNGETALNYLLDPPETVNIKVMDTAGRLWLQEEKSPPGRQPEVLSLSPKLPAGLYVVQFSTEKWVQSVRVLKL